MCLKGFEHHAHDKVKGLVTKAMDDLLCTNKVYRQYHYEDRNMDALSQVVESFMFQFLHKKLFASMCDIHRDQDANLKELSDASRDSLKLAQMGTGEAFAADDLPLAVATLTTLEERVTPLEKLLCLKETVEAVSSDLAAFREKQQADDRVRALNSSQGSLVTSDELLPLLVFVIVRSGVVNLFASVAYAESFTFFNVQTSELGFCLTSVQAALTLLLRSQLLRRNRREKYPDSRFNGSEEKQGRKSVSARRKGPSPPPALPRAISVPEEIHRADERYAAASQSARK